MLIHISEDRFNRIRSQGWQLGQIPIVSAEQSFDDATARYWYHVLDANRGICPTCHITTDSVLAETPAELEVIKLRMKAN